MAERRGAWLPVFRWEMKRVVMRADFILSVLLTPLLAVGSGMIGRAFVGGPAKVALVQLDAAGAAVARPALPAVPGVTWTDPPAGGADLAALQEAVRKRRLDGAVLVPHDLADSGRARVVVRSGSPRWVRPVERALGDLARAQRALAAGVSTEQLEAWDRAPEIDRVAAKPERGGGGGRAERIVVLVILFLLFTVLFSTISYLMVGISAEKQARVTEVVVSAIPAQSWMDGKIAAYTAIGLIMAAVWIASLLAAAVPMAFALPRTIDARLVAMTLLYAVLGLYFYNALFAAVLATMQGIQSSSRFQGYFFMLPMLPLLFLPAVIESPDAPWLAAVSMLPPFAPMLVPARMAIGGVPVWEAWLGLVILAVACWWMRGVAGRIFRVGMLMYGKDPTLPEILRWARVK